MVLLTFFLVVFKLAIDICILYFKYLFHSSLLWREKNFCSCQGISLCIAPRPPDASLVGPYYLVVLVLLFDFRVHVFLFSV